MDWIYEPAKDQSLSVISTIGPKGRSTRVYDALCWICQLLSAARCALGTSPRPSARRRGTNERVWGPREELDLGLGQWLRRLRWRHGGGSQPPLILDAPRPVVRCPVLTCIPTFAPAAAASLHYATFRPSAASVNPSVV